ncbi:MAG: polysaccharide deacetylase family protein [Candidatus Omnitrophica bacterium]|nr:polysaccharide deacetylase family protein [Candidatus Omnitrophota bacterium]
MKKLTLFFLIVGFLFGLFWICLNQNYATPILMYHSLDKSRVDSYAAVDPEVFRKQMEFIKVGGYKVVSLVEYCKLLKQGETIPQNIVVITFDDGYKDNLKAVEVLKEFGYPITIFVIAKEIGSNGFLSREDILSFLAEAEIKVNIGSHTLTHAYLPDQVESVMRREIFQSKSLLEENLSQDVETFSYPIGGFTKEALLDVEDAGYLCACTTNRGFSRKLNRFALRRIKITNRDSGFSLWAKLSGFYNSLRTPKNPY